MLSSLRQRYWIPGASTAIRKILAKCIVCRHLHAAPGHQQMADLPQDRVCPDEPPFSRVRVDCFGPFEIKRGRSMLKRYGVLFTCLTIRAIHIEVASSLETNSFINALRHFIARCGREVLEVRCDNGTNFVGAERELREAMESWNLAQINDALLQKGVQWMFNPPTGSHHGGVWERMIRSMRKVLNSSLKVQNLDEEGLHTVLCEVEAIVNSRPITKASTDPNDLEALTPNHLLLLKVTPSLPPGEFQKEDIYSRRRWKQVQYLTCFGSAGLRNTYHCFKRGRSGPASHATSWLEILCFWLMTWRLATHGLPGGSWKLYRIEKDSSVKYASGPRPAIWTGRSRRFAFCRRQMSHEAEL